MSLTPPAPVPVEPGLDPIGPADLQTASLTAIATSDVLLMLQHLWHGQVPDPIVWTVYLIVPYAVSQVSGRLVRKRRLAARQSPVSTPMDPPASTAPAGGA